MQHILDLKKHTTTITKFKNELQKTKNQLVPMYLKENQRKKLSTANMVTTLSSMKKSENMFLLNYFILNCHLSNKYFVRRYSFQWRSMTVVLDKYKHKVHIIDPRETTHEEFEKEKIDTDKLTEEEACRVLQENEDAREERERQFQEYHVHKSAIVSIYT